MHDDNYSGILRVQSELKSRGVNISVDGHMPIENNNGEPGETFSVLMTLIEKAHPKPPVSTPVPPPSLPGATTPTNKRKIWLSAGHGGTDPGASGSGFIEADLAIELRDLVRGRLPDETNVWTDPNAWATATTAPHIQSNSKSGDIVCDIHFNAYNGSAQGVEVIVPDSPTAYEIKLASAIARGIALVIKSPLRGTNGVKTESETARKRLAMMRPAGENVLIEVCFIDNRDEMGRYQLNKLTVAKVIADALLTT